MNPIDTIHYKFNEEKDLSNINSLIDGYKNFKTEYFTNKTIFNDLVCYGQKPKAIVVACSDARVDPAIVMNCAPGDLFVIRNVANLIPPYEEDNGYHGTSAALEFGVTTLGIRHIIIFGHSHCGGIASLFEKIPTHGFISKWMDLARPLYQMVLKKYTQVCQEEKMRLCGQASMINSIKNLKTFPWVQERLNAGQLFLHTWYFDLSTGSVFQIDE